MLKSLGFIISILLIIIILLRIPQENVGLTNITTKSNLFGSSNFAQKVLNILTVFGILSYLCIAIGLNLLKN